MIKCSYTKSVHPMELVPNPKNPNVHPPEQIERLAKVISFQGQRSPIVVSNRSGFVVVGHGRLEAIKKLGWESVGVDYQDFVSEAEEYAHMTADNALAEWASLDLSNVKDELLELGEEFDIDLLGIKNFNAFDFEEIEPERPDTEENKKLELIIEFKNDMEMRDLYDDLISKGYLARIRGE